MKWFRIFLFTVAAADLLLGMWLLIWPYHFMTLMRLPIEGEPIFVREGGSYMVFAALLTTLGGADPKGNLATCQATIVYRVLACIVEVVAVVNWLQPGVFRGVFTICALLDGSLALTTILFMRSLDLPWLPFQRAA